MPELDFDIPGPIGIQDIDVQQSFTKLKTNRTLLVTNLQLEGPYEPEQLPDEYTGSLTKLFEYAKPQVEVELETGNDENPTSEEVIKYENLKSFRPEEVVKRVSVLQNLSNEEKRFQKLIDEIIRSKKLQEIVSDPTKKAAFLDILESIKEELEGSGV